MGGSNVPQAFPNYLICLRFIRISTVTRRKSFSEKKDLGMACHTPPLQKKAMKQGEMPLPSLGPIPLYKNVEFRDWMGYDM